MRLHTYAASANCLKVRLLLRLLDLECEHTEVDIFAGDTLTDAFGRLNPVRETPVLELDTGAALTQSNAILGYLAEGTPWAGDGRLARGLVQSWLCFEQERVMTGIGGVRFRLITGRATADELAPRIALGRDALAVLEAHLTTRAWLVGDRPSIADVSIWAYAHLAGDAGLQLGPALETWSARLAQLPGWHDDLAPYGANARPAAGHSIYG